MVAQSWFKNLLTLKKPGSKASGERIGVLAFEASGLMTKLLQLWQLLTDRRVARLREDISNSIGIKKLVSENDDYIARLICAEMADNLVRIAKDVARLSKKCNSPLLRSFEPAFNDLINIGLDPFGWQLPWKKMEKNFQKMQQFTVMNSNLYQEMEILADIDQSYRRIKNNDSADAISFVEYEKRLTLKQQVVKHLKEKSLWNRTYDYTVLLLATSVFSIHGRIEHVFGINHAAVMRSAGASAHSSRPSLSTLFAQSSVYPFENSALRNSSTPSGRPVSVSGPLSVKMSGVNFQSGPLWNMEASSNPPEKHSGFSFYSGPLKVLSVKSSSVSSSVSRKGKGRFQLWPTRGKSQDLQVPGGSAMASSPLPGFSYDSSLVSTSHMNSGDQSLHPPDRTQDTDFKARFNGGSSHGDSSVSSSKSKILNPPPETLGAAALAIHYANIIVFIEKLIVSPHLIGQDTRKDLYSMLPARIRIALRDKLKPYAKSLTASVSDTALAGEWSDAIQRILDWLSPLAHSMIKWQSERSFEHQNSSTRTNVLLVQTLYFANQEKTEAVITELLVGLNYIWRYGREIAAVSLAGYARRLAADEYLDD